MKSLIYNVLSKGLLILVLLALAAGYYYRAQLFPQFFAGAPSTVAEPQGAADTDTDTTPSSAQGDDSPPPAAEAVAEPGVAAVSLPAAEAEPAPQAALPEPTAEPAATAPPVQWPEAPVDVAQPAPADDDTVSDPLQRARRAYWAGDIQGAVAAYAEAAAARPEDPDVHGERGNILFSQGDWQGAADAYLAAGRALIANGDVAAAEHMVAVLQGLDDKQAASLADELAQQRQGIARQ